MTAWRNYNGYHGGNYGGSSGGKRKDSKYHSKKAALDGEVFDSRKEARRWRSLKLLEQAGEIKNLQRQVKYLLIPEAREPDEIGPRGGVKKGKIIESAVYYVADFVYFEPGVPEGQWIVEDTKGFRTKDYILKRKLMLYKYGIRIRET